MKPSCGRPPRSSRAGHAYPYDELEEIWRDVLLNQFHDILPGSSIAMVNDDAIASHARSAGRLEAIIDRAITSLSSPPEDAPGAGGGEPGSGAAQIAFNAAPHEQNGVPAFGAGPMAPPSGEARVTGATVLENDLVRVELNADGHIVSLLDRTTGREVDPARLSRQRAPASPGFPQQLAGLGH